jgi:hypothetical protein
MIDLLLICTVVSGFVVIQIGLFWVVNTIKSMGGKHHDM